MDMCLDYTYGMIVFFWSWCIIGSCVVCLVSRRWSILVGGIVIVVLLVMLGGGLWLDVACYEYWRLR